MTKLAQKILDRLVTAGNKLRSNPKQGIEFLLAQRSLLLQQTLEAESWDGLENWAFFFKDLFDHADHLPSRGQELEAAREAVERFGIDHEIFQPSDLRVVRIVLRQAHAILAEEALNRGDLEEAISQIGNCFELKSISAECGDPFAPYVVLRARILLSTCGSGNVTRERFFDALLQAEKKAALQHEARLALEAAPTELCAWLEHPDFIAYKAKHSVEKLRRGCNGAKWSAAVNRVETLIATLWPDGSSESVIRYTPETPETLAIFEARIGCEIPTPLRFLYLEHGAFTLRDPSYWRSLRLLDSGARLRMLAGLQAAIDDLWGGRPEFADSFDASDIDRLNREFIAFGYFCHNDNEYTHLYFTRSGGFGSLYYDQDDWDSAYALLEQMLVNPDEGTGTLDEMINKFANQVVDALIAERDEDDNKA